MSAPKFPRERGGGGDQKQYPNPPIDTREVNCRDLFSFWDSIIYTRQNLIFIRVGEGRVIH